MPLTRQDVLARALDLLDEAGFPSLTMRRLATSLGVQPSALYWHIPNKQTLLAGLAERMLTDRATTTAHGPVRARILAWAMELRRSLTQYRDGAEVVASVLAMRLTHVDPIAEFAAELLAWGVPAQRAEVTARTVVHFTLGHCIDEQAHAEMVAFDVASTIDDADLAEQRFTAGIALITGALSDTPGEEATRPPQVSR